MVPAASQILGCTALALGPDSANGMPLPGTSPRRHPENRPLGRKSFFCLSFDFKWLAIILGTVGACAFRSQKSDHPLLEIPLSESLLLVRDLISVFSGSVLNR
jgi:hypothetical protein